MIRHGMTFGNTLRRYIGRTDEPLCEEGRRVLEEVIPPVVSRVYASPMKRCIETAGILFPGVEPVVVDDFRECDFGDFENRNYKELDGNKDYQAFVDSGATLPFPNGESREGFQERCVRAFREVAEREACCAAEDCRGAEPETDVRDGAGAFGCTDIARVVHGGTIMSILGEFADPKEDYFYWQAANGEGFVCTLGESKDGGIRLYDIQYLGSDFRDPS